MADNSDTVEYDESATCWHLMVTTYGGKVGMLRNLDAPTARQAYRRLRPDEYPREYINMPEGGFSWGSGGYSVTDDRVKSVDILGPEGASLDPWRGCPPRVIDMQPEVDRQERCKAEARARRQKADEMAAGLHVISDLRPELSDSGYRCSSCNKTQPAGSLLYYLPDGVRRGDPVETIKSRIERNRWNGHSSGWCASCVPKEKSGPSKSFLGKLGL